VDATLNIAIATPQWHYAITGYQLQTRFQPREQTYCFYLCAVLRRIAPRQNCSGTEINYHPYIDGFSWPVPSLGGPDHVHSERFSR
jgi:hypothetical protein